MKEVAMRGQTRRMVPVVDTMEATEETAQSQNLIREQ